MSLAPGRGQQHPQSCLFWHAGGCCFSAHLTRSPVLIAHLLLLLLPPGFRFTFDVPKTKCIVHDGDRQDVRLLLLKEELDAAGGSGGQPAWGQQEEGALFGGKACSASQHGP